MLDWNLTPLMRAIVDAAESMGGGGRDARLSHAAAARGETGHMGDHAHFAKGYRALEARGILRHETTISGLHWWLTEQAWREMGHRGPAPGTEQERLFG